MITSSQDGYIEWIISTDRNGRRRGHGLRLVHQFLASPLGGRNGCQSDPGTVERRYHGLLYDQTLTDFLGADGLMRSVELITKDALPTAEVVEMIKRLHIPGYELARQHSEHAQRDDVLELDAVPDYWRQTEISAILQDISVR
jgi:hypothetical protein